MTTDLRANLPDSPKGDARGLCTSVVTGLCNRCTCGRVCQQRQRPQQEHHHHHEQQQKQRQQQQQQQQQQ